MKRFLMLALLMTPILSHAEREEGDPAAARYAQDRQLCNDESTADARMQCLRDARAEYEKARATDVPARGESRSVSGMVCADCGKVLSVKVGEKQGQGSALGMIGGGVVGALLGNQVGRGTGRDIATIAGAAGGAYAGNRIEQNMKSAKYWAVTVRFDNGDTRTFDFDHDPGFFRGDHVRKSGNSIIHR